ncbi:Pentatricopeptide repeat-containing protein [Hibiscus syriacus]|uniref:Pentatricopeptide repeat-containing protein n=1 Tax=Hibiscus syriacus TaxID=106335 RepID=A0A6A3CL71_HIBSY|nr:pentatricopeptide repeat-containing protein At3g02330, mitochondrial-like [Hibiscus syriacus]KAE8729576.1 Pentatricopeptide repeat-containing protein [Hibiscus syriacus]
MAYKIFHFNFPKLLFSHPLSKVHPLKTLSVSTLATNHTIPKSKKTFSHIFQECSCRTSLNPGKQAHCQMIISGFVPTVFVANCLIQLYIKCGHLGYATKVFDKMYQPDVVSWNAMIFGYASYEMMGSARRYFDDMPEKDVISWNSLISGYLKNGECLESILVFLEMRKAGVGFDWTTFAVVLKSCAVLKKFDVGIQVHGVAVKGAFDKDVITGSALVDLYGKCSRLDDSIRFFYQMPEKNWVSWSAVIAGCVQNGKFIKGVELFKEMQRGGIGVSQSTYASVFRSCSGFSAFWLGRQLHGHSLKTNFASDLIVGTAILDMYAKCGSMIEAQKIFNLFPIRNLQSFNAIIIGYAQSCQAIPALHLFRHLLKSDIGFDEISLSGAFSACAVIKGYLEGVQVHALAVKSTLESNICVANAILDMYGKSGALAEACHVFYEMEKRDAISWNAIIAAHEQNGNEEATLAHFASMLHSGMEPDEFTYGSVLKACAGQKALDYGMGIHNRTIKSGVVLHSFVGSALVDMYCKCGMMEEAENIHDRIEQKSMVCWNAIISGFSLQKESEEAQNFFSRMLEIGVKPDHFTYATVLDTCANLATIGLGKQIHAQIIKLELQSDVYICSTLLDMYSKCGNTYDSKLIFEKATNRDFVTWNAMICGYAQHGLGEEALQVFEDMIIENVTPNHATFVSVLRACAHTGLVEKGLHYFALMSSDYGLAPQLEHYSCMVHIMGRAGQITEALRLINDMPFEADDVIWRTLLNICKIHGNVEVAEKVADSLLQLDPQDSSAYILLSNIYADAGLWGKVSYMRKLMRYNKLKKEPGCSWIEIKDEVHAFLVGEKAHPRCKEIYEMLGVLVDEMRCYMADTVFLLEEEANQLQGQKELKIILCNFKFYCLRQVNSFSA